MRKMYMSDKGGHSNMDDSIYEDVRQICEKLDLGGEHCLFMRVSDGGITATGSKKGELFLDQQPEICQQFRSFCSGVYGSRDVTVKLEHDMPNDLGMSAIGPGQSDPGDEVQWVVSVDMSQTDSDDVACDGGEDGSQRKNDRTASWDNRTAGNIDGTAAVNTSADQVEETKTLSGRKRTVNIPIKLRGFEMHFKKKKDSPGKSTQSKIEGQQKSSRKLGRNKSSERRTTAKMSKTSKKNLLVEKSAEEMDESARNGSRHRQQRKAFKGDRKAQKRTSASGIGKRRTKEKGGIISGAQSEKSKEEDVDQREKDFINDQDEDHEGMDTDRTGKRVTNNGGKEKTAKRESEGVIKLGETILNEVSPLSALPGKTNVKEEQEDGTVCDESVRCDKKRKQQGRNRCDSCGLVMGTQLALKRHHRKNGCVGVKLKTQTNVTDEQDSFMCKTCDRGPFTSLFMYQRHVIRHQLASTTVPSQFQCSLCAKNFLYDNERVAHIFQIHKKSGPVDCLVCYHSFVSLTEYRKHRKYCSSTTKCEGVGQQATPGEGQGEATVKVESTGDCQGETNSISRRKTTDNSPSQGPEASQVIVGNSPGREGQITPNGQSQIKEKVLMSCGMSVMFDPSKIYRTFVAASDGNPCDPSLEKQDGLPAVQAVSDTNQVAIEAEQDGDLDSAPLVCKTCHKDIRSLFIGESIDNTCQVCRRWFTSSRQLNKHKAIHSATQFYRCHICNKCFVEPRYVQSHLMHSHKKRYSICRHCCGLFHNRDSLVRHIKEKHGNKCDTTCRVCGEQFADRVQCLEHDEKQHHTLIDPRESVCICDICGKVLSGRSSLRSHLKMHSNVRTHECPHCKRKYRGKAQLAIHLQIHDSVKKYQCEVCGECFKLQSTLNQHVYVHNDRKQYECPECGLQFRSTDGMNHHTLRHHVGVEDIGKLSFKVRQCEICGVLKATKQQYNLHMMLHTKYRPYKCLVCEKLFGARPSLLRHIRKVHQQHGVHTCLICNCNICAITKWKRHMRTKKHLDLCEKSGVDPEGLKLGMHYIVHRADENDVERLMEWVGEGDETEFRDNLDRKGKCVPTSETNSLRGRPKPGQATTNVSLSRRTNHEQTTALESIEQLGMDMDTVESVPQAVQDIEIIVDMTVDGSGNRPLQVVESQEAVEMIEQTDGLQDIVQGQLSTIDETTLQNIVYLDVVNLRT